MRTKFYLRSNFQVANTGRVRPGKRENEPNELCKAPCLKVKGRRGRTQTHAGSKPSKGNVELLAFYHPCDAVSVNALSRCLASSSRVTLQDGLNCT